MMKSIVAELVLDERSHGGKSRSLLRAPIFRAKSRW
jgi:hypothetical protein